MVYRSAFFCLIMLSACDLKGLLDDERTEIDDDDDDGGSDGFGQIDPDGGLSGDGEGSIGSGGSDSLEGIWYGYEYCSGIANLYMEVYLQEVSVSSAQGVGGMLFACSESSTGECEYWFNTNAQASTNTVSFSMADCAYYIDGTWYETECFDDGFSLDWDGDQMYSDSGDCELVLDWAPLE